MHDALYEHQARLGPEFVTKEAARLHLDLDVFNAAIDSGQARGRVEHDFMDGVRSGVNGTPTFFINGTRFDDSWDEETLGAAIEHAIAGRTPAAESRARPANQTRR
jgi:protein-disulfide isomerase